MADGSETKPAGASPPPTTRREPEPTDSLARSAGPLARLAHELANPLAVVHGALEYLQAELEEIPGGAHEALADSLTATRQLRGILDTLRALSSAEPATRLDDLAALATTLLPAVGRRRTARATVDVDTRPGLVLAARRGTVAHLVVALIAWGADVLAGARTSGRVELRARGLGERLVALDVLVRVEGKAAEEPPPSSSGLPTERSPLELAHAIVDELGGSVHVETPTSPSAEAARLRVVLSRA